MLIRNLTRVAAAGLLAAGGVAIAAAPALAADVDLGVQLSGTTIALGSPEKRSTVDITNLGATKPAGVRIVVDLTEVDPRIVVNEEDCTASARVYTCGVEDAAVPGPGQTARLELRLGVGGAGGRGDMGELKATVVAEGDADLTNNSATADVVLSERSGIDLRVTAFDIDANGASEEPLQPGERSATWGVIINNGDVDARQVQVAIKLPPQVTFVNEDEGCEYNAAKTEATCSFGDKAIIPAWTSNEEPLPDRTIGAEFEVQLSADAEGPATVSGGVWSVSGEVAESRSATTARAAATELPSWAKPITAAELADQDVDPSDDTDTFAVLIAGEGTGNGDGNGNGGGGGADDPELPITGPVAGQAAGVGAGLVGLGVMLVLASRRRRAEGVE